MTDILLTHAYYLSEDPAERQVMKPYPPLGLLYITSYLRSLGFDVDLIDSTFMSRTEHLKAIRDKRAPLVGIYVNLLTRTNALQVIRVAGQTGSRVVLGGPEPVNYAEEYLDRGADVIVSGEGELTLAELIPSLVATGAAGLEHVSGVIFRHADGTIVTTPPRAQIKSLDSRPYPARESIDMKQYMAIWRTHHGASSVSLITARGCPYRCRWCSHSVYGFTFRHRSPEDVADELEHIRDTYNPDQVWYADDVFTMSHHWLQRFAATLDRRGLYFPFETISREDRLNEETVRTLAEMGCYRLWVGAESGSQRILDAMERRTNVERMRDVIELLKNHGIRAGTFIMLGYDGETWDDINDTTRYLKTALPDDVMTTLAYPIKGTPYYDIVKDRMVSLKSWDEGSDRDVAILGRGSRRFYRHARSWIRSEVELARAYDDGQGDITTIARTFLRAKRDRTAMYLTRHEIEDGRPDP